jgi:hypothetical protein
MNTQNIEAVSLTQSLNLSEFLNCLHLADRAELIRYEETEKAIGLLKLMRQQYSTLQLGTQKTLPPQAGEMPATMYLAEIENLYKRRKDIAEATKQEFTLQWDSFRDSQVRQLKHYIETGELYNRKKETLQERATVAIDKLEKRLSAEKAIADKAALDKKKADADAVKAFTNADAVKADANKVIIEVSDLIDNNPNHADAVKRELVDIVDAVKADVIKADAVKADAVKVADKAQTTKVKADADVDKTKKELDKVKAKLTKLSAPKAENNKTDPSLNFKTTNFSQDCKDTALMILEELEREATSAPELLYLAKLILDKYNK